MLKAAVLFRLILIHSVKKWETDSEAYLSSMISLFLCLSLKVQISSSKQTLWWKHMHWN